jgi:hypothetical protein
VILLLLILPSTHKSIVLPVFPAKGVGKTRGRRRLGTLASSPNFPGEDAGKTGEDGKNPS